LNDKRAVIFCLTILLLAGTVVGYAAVPQSTVRTTGAGITTYVGHYLNGTLGWYQGATERLDALGNAVFTTVDTGQGANELFDMDQNVLQTSSPTFDELTLSGDLINTYNFTQMGQYPQQPASYIVWEDGGIYYAKNGNNGAIDYSGTNASIVIQAALDSGRLHVNLRRGTYDLGSQGIVLSLGDWLSGEGRGIGTSTGNVTVLAYSGSGVAVTLGSGMAATDYTMKLTDLCVLDEGAVASDGILLINSYDSVVTDVSIRDFVSGNGIRLFDDGDQCPANNIRNIRIRNCDYGIHITGDEAGDLAIRNNFYSIHISGGGGNTYGIYLDRARYCDFFSIDIHDIDTGVYSTGEAKWCEFYSLQLEACTTDINIAAVNRYHSFYGGTITWSKVTVSDANNYFDKGGGSSSTIDMGINNIAIGVTKRTITHNLGGTPDHVSISFKENMTNPDVWWWNASATQISINVDKPTAAARDFSWMAWYQP